MKNVLLLVVDACSSRVFVPALENGRLPNLRDLSLRGALHPASTAIFPSITPAATSSIVTGRYPYEHGIAGAHWYNKDTDTVVYYGPDVWLIVEKGIGTFLDDFLVELNHRRLRADTLFQTLENAGRTAACLNYLIFNGNVSHTVDLPTLAGLLPGVPATEEVYGASILYWGDFVATRFETIDATLESVGGPQHRFGFTDDATAGLLAQMAEHRLLPDFTLAYFPDNDFESHEVGPEDAVGTLEALDEELGAVIDGFGGVEPMLEEVCVILTGDHSQTDVVADEETAGIDVENLLSAFSVAPPGEPWQQDDELVVCPNLRAAQVYLHYREQMLLDGVTDAVLADERIDQVIWRATLTNPEERGFHVVTRDRSRLHFWAGDDGPNTAVDEYGYVWSWEGELTALGGRVSDDGTVEFPDYPNAFERIAGSVSMEHSGDVWLTARPGHEFRYEHTALHAGGGSHGSLHRDDSTSPLLIAGPPDGLELSAPPRAVDIAPLCLRILGIEPPYDLSASHVSGT